MSIIYLQNKYKSKYSLNLIPNRTWSSGSNGIDGSVYVFPNRSEIQKDNIDERLELAGTYGTNGSDQIERIKKFSDMSLEQFRLDILANSFYDYQMNFLNNDNLRTAQVFLERYNANNLASLFIPTLMNQGKSRILTHEQITEVIQIINNNLADFWDRYRPNKLPELNINTIDDKIIFPPQNFVLRNMDPQIYNMSNNVIDTLPYNPSLELPVALLLDGAHPAAADHSFTSGTNGWVFSGNKIIFDDPLDFTNYTLGDQITSFDQLELWPPEIDKYLIEQGLTTINGLPDRKNFNFPFTTIGYSDVSMHPRNRAKKDISVLRCNQSILSKANAAQKIAYNNLSSQITKDFGWWVNNKFSLNLSSWEDNDGIEYFPTISYGESNNIEATEFKKTSANDWMFEFWIKPSELQIDIGTIFYLYNNYAVLIKPIKSENNKAKEFDIIFSWDEGANEFSAGTILVNTWNHICIRYSPNFNNAQLNIIINGISNVDNADTITSNLGKTGKRLWIGGIPDANDNDFEDMEWQGFSTHDQSNSQNLTINNYLVSEIHELRIWNVANDVQTISDLKYSNLDDTSDLCFYAPLTFESTLNDQDWKKHNWKGNIEASSIEEFYETAPDPIYGSTKLKELPIDCNNAFITGVPFLNVHQFLKNQAAKENTELSMAFVSGFPSFNVPIGDGPNFMPTEHNMNSWMENWPEMKFLKCINSMLLPCDNSNFNNDINPFVNMFLNNTSENVEGIFDDEIITAIELTLQDSTAEDQKAIIQNWHNQTESWYEKSTFLDFLNPTSIIINIPQIFYANHITPETVVINAVIDSKGKVITLKDKEGILYRYTDNNLNGKVGHIDYYNGQIVIFHPSLTNFSLYDWDITFKGNKNLHVMQIDVPCESYKHNISFNESHNPKSLASSNANETNSGYKFISNINLHDDNMNVIAKVHLAQPIVKRNEDSFVFRVKLDF